jgi:hypothetical protein
MMQTKIRKTAIGCSLLAVGLLADGVFNGGMFTKEAQAIIGRPLTPLSYAGVARRTTRRVIRRTTIYRATLPVGCTTVVMEGMTLHQCGTTYYQPYGNQFVVVEVD